MKRSLIINAMALVAGLVLAFVVWTAGEVEKDPKPVLLNWQAEDLQRVSYDWPEGHSLVERGEKTDAWVMSLTQKAPAVPLGSNPLGQAASASSAHQPVDAGTAGEAGSTPETTPKPPATVAQVKTTRRFPAGSLVLRALKKLTPLQASYDLGKLDAAALKKMDLAPAQRSLRLTSKKGEQVFDIGGKSYGGRGVYARLQGGDEVYLLPPEISAGFEGPEGKLMEWRLVPRKPEEVSAVVLTMGAKSQRFIQVESKTEAQRYYALAESPENKSDPATALVSRLFGLRAKAYLQQAPTPVQASEVATVAVQPVHGTPLILAIFERSDGLGYWLRSGPWFAELPSAQVRPVVDALGALLSDSDPD